MLTVTKKNGGEKLKYNNGQIWHGPKYLKEKKNKIFWATFFRVVTQYICIGRYENVGGTFSS